MSSIYNSYIISALARKGDIDKTMIEADNEIFSTINASTSLSTIMRDVVDNKPALPVYHYGTIGCRDVLSNCLSTIFDRAIILEQMGYKIIVKITCKGGDDELLGKVLEGASPEWKTKL